MLKRTRTSRSARGRTRPVKAKPVKARPLFPGYFKDGLTTADRAVAAAIRRELGRQQHEIELIASENIVSKAVLEAQGSILTNKYAEGYPGRRYYGGCQYVDEAEELAMRGESSCSAVRFVNVQPHSGAQANQAVFFAAEAWRHLHGVEPGGRRAPHPWLARQSVRKMVSSRSLWRAARRPAGSTMMRSSGIADAERPKLILAGGSAYPRIIDFARFRADRRQRRRLLHGRHGAHRGPRCGRGASQSLPHAHVVTTTTHKTLRGPRGGLILSNDEESGQKINSAVFPGLQGGPLMHAVAAKAVALGEALKPAFKTYARDCCLQCQGAGRDHGVGRARYHLGRHRHPSHACRCAREEAHRQARRSRRSGAPTSRATRTAFPSIRKNR